MIRRFRRPSPALVLAWIAVFMIGAGGATAASKLIDGKKIKKGSIPTKALSKAAIKALKGKAGPQGIQGPQGAQGGQGNAGADATKLWAVVGESGTIARNSGAVSATIETNGGTTVHYDVKFNRDVSQCAYLATVGEADGISNTVNVRARTITVAPKAGAPTTIVVEVYSYTDDLNPIQDAFHVAVFC